MSTKTTVMVAMALAAAGGAARTDPLPAAADSIGVETVLPCPAGEARGGATVLLVPGLSGCAYGWRKVAPLLEAAGCRVIIVEPLGIGGAPRPADADYSLTAQADRLAASIDSLGGEPAIVVAHGVSGSMALRLAYRRPQLVRGVVSIEGGPTDSAASPGVAAALGKARLVSSLGGGGLIRGRFRASLMAASGDASWVDETTVRRYLSGMTADLGAAARALRAMAEAAEPERLADHLDRIACPVTLLLGGAPHDCGLPADQVATMRDKLPSLTVEVIAGAGHFIQEERPEAVAGAVLLLAAPAPGAVARRG